MNPKLSEILQEIEKVVVGKNENVEKIMMAVLAGGHVLMEDVPGTGKTTTAMAFAKVLGLDTRRVQFTSDTVPSDIIGYSVYEKQTGGFVFKPGAIMTNLLLADEINRTSSKTQSALLEAMEEMRVTVDGQTYPLPSPFVVLATQNPVGSAGTQMLPSAQMDRFMIKISMGYPDFESQISILRDRHRENPLDKIQPKVNIAELQQLIEEASAVQVMDCIYEYVTKLTQDYQDELHRPAFPYKFKFKFDGCPNGCVCAMARSDFAVVGTWKDDIKIDQDAVKAYVGGEFKPNAGAHAGRDWGKFDIQAEVVDRGPSKCMSWDGSKLSIKTADCVRCMHCINTMPRALHIGDERGASILVGAKAPVVDGAQMGSLLVPFISCEAPYDEIKEVIEKIWDWWMEEGKNRERVGETMKRLSFQKLLEVTDTEAAPYHVTAPRSNPYIFFKEEEVPGGWTRDLAEFRKRHQR